VLLERACTVFVDTRYANLAQISVAHLYNLRKSAGYQRRRQHWTKTRPTPIAIRREPRPDGIPGYIRIDSVHQGDQDGFKGVYHINPVNCVTQWELWRWIREDYWNRIAAPLSKAQGKRAIKPIGAASTRLARIGKFADVPQFTFEVREARTVRIE